jgi:hypothetical protein
VTQIARELSAGGCSLVVGCLIGDTAMQAA